MNKATIQIGVGTSVVNIGANIPIAKKIIVTKNTGSNEAEWKFEEVKFGQGTQVAIGGAIELAFLPGSQGHLVSPTVFVEVIFGKGRLQFSKDIELIRLNADVNHTIGLRPFNAQQLTRSKAKNQSPAPDIIYYNPNCSATSENRYGINDKFAELAHNAKNLKLLF